ncbi:MAG TPA: M15 family metallopeptidase [Mollicutes bacterium]|nr:M15 family metallopeptidase [Mollicutes bacterium]
MNKKNKYVLVKKAAYIAMVFALSPTFKAKESNVSVQFNDNSISIESEDLSTDKLDLSNSLTTGDLIELANYKRALNEAKEEMKRKELYMNASGLILDEVDNPFYIKANHEHYISFYMQNPNMNVQDVFVGVNIKLCESLPCYNSEYTKRYIDYHIANPNLPLDQIIVYVNIGLDKPFYTNIKMIENPNSELLISNKYNKLPADFVPNGYNEKVNKDLTVRGEAGRAFKLMTQSAAKEKVTIYPVSTYRSYNYQEDVYWRQSKLDAFFGSGTKRKNLSENKKNEYHAWRDKVSAREGHSEHQTGLAVDINSVSESFAKTKEGKWLANNSYKFGYILRYPKGKEDITGYSYEPWHFRYVGVKVATAVYESGLTFDEFHAMYIEPIIRKDPKTSELSSDEFYDLFIKDVYENTKVYNFVKTDEDTLEVAKTK